MLFLDAVNRMLRINGFIRGDTDALTSFSDTAHNSSSQLCQIAVQQEITELTSRGLLPYQHTESASLVLVAAQREYTFPTNFIKMWGDPTFFFDSNQNVQVYEFSGGENQLRRTIITYRTDAGYPQWFYFVLSSAGYKVGFYPVPGADLAGRNFYYDYSASANVSAASDTIPLATVDQQYAFIDMAARRFKFLFEGKVDMPVDLDPVYRDSRARLFALLTGKEPARHYGYQYG